MLDLARILAAVTAVTEHPGPAVTAPRLAVTAVTAVTAENSEDRARSSSEAGPDSWGLSRVSSSVCNCRNCRNPSNDAACAVTATGPDAVTAVTEPPEQAGATFRAWRIRFTSGDRCTAVHPLPVSADLARADALEQFGAGRVAGIEPT